MKLSVWLLMQIQAKFGLPKMELGLILETQRLEAMKPLQLPLENLIIPPYLMVVTALPALIHLILVIHHIPYPVPKLMMTDMETLNLMFLRGFTPYAPRT
jgi:hypothetical protein